MEVRKYGILLSYHYKILKFAGVSMKALDIMSAGQTQEQAQVQQEKQ